MAGVDLGGQRGERDLLTGFLDWHRGGVENMLEGLSLSDATRVMTSTGLSMLGVVKHLGWVERGWFRDTFAGEDVPAIAVADDNTIEFRVEPADTMESVIAFYREETGHSRRITASAPSLDELSMRETPWYGRVSLRWILTHLLEETARHLGHLDLMREEIDGRTGMG